MSKKNPEYDFKWCPGCGDFGVRRAIEAVLQKRLTEKEEPIENTVIVAGIGCSGNLVHLLEGPQPYGFHGIHGRTLPVSFGIKNANPKLNVLIVAGDGDFLSIGMEHIAPQAARNLDVTAIIMDNGVYGLTKGQSSPTSKSGEITSSTPYGKIEKEINPLEIYLSLGVSFIASAFSGKIKQLTNIIEEAIEHPGFSIINVQSPCTTYNNTYEQLKGSKAKNIAPIIQDIPADHDVTNKQASYNLINQETIPLGTLYKSIEKPFTEKFNNMIENNTTQNSAAKLLESYKI